jgi:hypothetical protein
LKLSCYVYYRVLPDHVTQASAAAHETIRAMRMMTGVNARLMTKVAEPLLWMEVYEDIGDQDAFLSALRRCLQTSGLERWLADGGNRHTEVFGCA